jgi:hypothetical protein
MHVLACRCICMLLTLMKSTSNTSDANAKHSILDLKSGLLQTGWRPRVEEMRSAFDAGVRGALDDALLLLRPPASGAPDAHSGLGIRRASSGRLPASPWAAELEPFVQERCDEPCATRTIAKGSMCSLVAHCRVPRCQRQPSSQTSRSSAITYIHVRRASAKGVSIELHC